MYGLINKAIEEMVTTQFEEEKWEKVKQKAGVHVETFLAMQRYPDEMTYRLVGGISEVLQIPAQRVLQLFGQFWVKFIIKEGYGELVRMSGTTLFESLQKMDQLHSRLTLSFPDYEPPSFRCTEVTEKTMRLHYHSDRAGLSHFVVGLVEGMAEMYNQKATVILDKNRDQGHSHDEFLIACE